MPSIAGLVLAAGRAQRMGGRPKPLLELDGQPLISRLVGAMGEAGVGPVLIVIPSPGLSSPAAPFATAIARALEGSAARTV
ncbi:MAG: NTP transferase domain-containing protein, partial [Rubrivivax sp.]